MKAAHIYIYIYIYIYLSFPSGIADGKKAITTTVMAPGLDRGKFTSSSSSSPSSS